MAVRVLVLQHHPLDGPGYLGAALQRHGATLDVVRLDLGESLPDVGGYDALLVMGGEMNVYQELEYPWLVAEHHLLQRALAAEIPVLGICLGGQLLAKALGAPVRLGAAPEVGIVPITLTSAGRRDPLFAGLSGSFSDPGAFPASLNPSGHPERPSLSHASPT